MPGIPRRAPNRIKPCIAIPDNPGEPEWLETGVGVESSAYGSQLTGIESKTEISERASMATALALLDRMKIEMPELWGQSPQEISSKEFKIVALRECPVPELMHLCDTPDRAAEYSALPDMPRRRLSPWRITLTPFWPAVMPFL